jgi:hypothetical protein
MAHRRAANVRRFVALDHNPKPRLPATVEDHCRQQETRAALPCTQRAPRTEATPGNHWPQIQRLGQERQRDQATRQPGRKGCGHTITARSDDAVNVGPRFRAYRVRSYCLRVGQSWNLRLRVHMRCVCVLLDRASHALHPAWAARSRLPSAVHFGNGCPLPRCTWTCGDAPCSPCAPIPPSRHGGWLILQDYGHGVQHRSKVRAREGIGSRRLRSCVVSAEMQSCHPKPAPGALGHPSPPCPSPSASTPPPPPPPCHPPQFPLVVVGRVCGDPQRRQEQGNQCHGRHQEDYTHGHQRHGRQAHPPGD